MMNAWELTFVGHIKPQLGVEGTDAAERVHDQRFGRVQEVFGCAGNISRGRVG